MSSVSETNDARFQQEVLQSELPVLVDFWAPWCGPCRALGPTIDAISQELVGKLHVYKLNTDDNPKVTEMYGIRSIPTVIFFSGGQPKGQIIGMKAKGDILRMIEDVLGVKA